MIKDINGLIAHLTAEIKKNTDVAVIGLSGGADSTLVAILCKLALGEDNVVGVHMPYSALDTDDTKFNARSVRIARKLEIKEEYIPINIIADSIILAIDPATFDNDDKSKAQATNVDKGNARARARMCVLYGLSGILSHGENKRVRVIGTGNLSEDWIGYDTKFGDAGADFHPIGRLYKSEVYQLLEHFINIGVVDEEHVDRVPSAALWPGQTDESELGYSYNEMEIAIRKSISVDRSFITYTPDEKDAVEKFVTDRHIANKHKHEAIPSFDIKEYVD